MNTEQKVKTCQVWRCPEPAKYFNPESGFKYCQGHYDDLGGWIILDSRSRPIQRIKLLKIRGA